MKIKQNGAYIHIEYEGDLQEMKSLYCVCGHPLVNHTYGNTYGTKRTYEIKGCEICNCGQFKLKGKIETRNHCYAEQETSF